MLSGLMRPAAVGVACVAAIAAGMSATRHASFPAAASARGRTTRVEISPTRVIIDTDIGDDIDDAFAVSLALNSPELEIDGITTAWGDTHLRARLVNRLLAEVGRTDIPVAEGIVTHSKVRFTQARWAQGGAEPNQHVDAVDFLLRQIGRHTGEMTVIAIAPLTNIAAAIDREPATFRRVRRIVMMGGSIRRGYLDPGAGPNPPPDPEYNIASDVAAAQKVFRSGVPIFMLPLDSTQIRLDEVHRGELFASGTPITDALTLLYHQWGQTTPVLYDPVAVSYAIRPDLCPMQPLRVEIDKDGYTRVGDGTPNVTACLASDREKMLDFLMPRLMAEPRAAK